MEVVSKIYNTMGVGALIKDLNLKVLNDIKNTPYWDVILSEKVKNIICTLSDEQIELISDIPISYLVIRNEVLKVGIEEKFKPRELSQALEIKTEAFFLMQRMAVNSASLEFAFNVDSQNQRYIRKMTLTEMKASAQYSKKMFDLRKGNNFIRWENLIKILQHPDTTASNIKELVMLCLK